jgi:hypothetical protein
VITIHNHGISKPWKEQKLFDSQNLHEEEEEGGKIRRKLLFTVNSKIESMFTIHLNRNKKRKKLGILIAPTNAL